MKRRDFIGAAGKSLLLTPLLADRIAGNQMKIESAFRVQIGYPLADPFCMSTRDGYYLIGTLSKGYNPQSEYLYNIFHSSDLKSWTHHGRILKQPEYEGSRKANYWAPEILPFKGKFYLYYTSDSFGDPYRRFVRVAVAEEVTGPYLDSGKKLVRQPSIDGHPFYVSPEMADRIEAAE